MDRPQMGRYTHVQGFYARGRYSRKILLGISDRSFSFHQPWFWNTDFNFRIRSAGPVDPSGSWLGCTLTILFRTASPDDLIHIGPTLRPVCGRTWVHNTFELNANFGHTAAMVIIQQNLGTRNAMQ